MFPYGSFSQEWRQLNVALELPDFDELSLDAQSIIEICSKKLAEKGKADPGAVAKVLLARARAYIRSKRYEDALRDVNQCLSISKDSDGIRRTRAAIYFFLDRLADAEADIEEGIRLNPKSASHYVAKAVLRLSKQDRNGGLNALEKAASLDPDDALVYFYRGACFHRLDPEKCLADMNKFLELSPYFPSLPPDQAYYFRGYSLFLLNRPNEALPSLLLARKLNPSSDIIARDISLTYAELQKFHLAAHYADEFARLCPRNPPDPEVFSLRAEYYFRIGKTKEAIEFAERHLARAKDDPSQFDQIAYVHVAIRRYKGALEFYDKGINEAEDDYWSLVGKSKLLSSCPDPRIRDGEEAVKLAMKAYRKLGAGRKKCMGWMPAIALAQGYAEVGNFKAAVQFAEESIELAGPKFGGMKELKDKLSLFKRNMPYRLEAD
jgi:tetratricopeptide (TPR) repeat protein